MAEISNQRSLNLAHTQSIKLGNLSKSKINLQPKRSKNGRRKPANGVNTQSQLFLQWAVMRQCSSTQEANMLTMSITKHSSILKIQYMSPKLLQKRKSLLPESPLRKNRPRKSKSQSLSPRKSLKRSQILSHKNLLSHLLKSSARLLSMRPRLLRWRRPMPSKSLNSRN